MRSPQAATVCKAGLPRSGGAFENSGWFRRRLSAAPTAEGALAMLQNELAEPIRRGQAERLQPRRTLLARIGKPASGDAAGRDDPDQSAPLAERQQSGRRGLHELIVIKRAVVARNFVETLIGGAERVRQRYQVGLLGDGVGANQHALRADADRLGATLSGGQDPARQQMADASSSGQPLGRLDNVVSWRPRCGRVVRDATSVSQIFRFGAANGRSPTATDHHGWPPTQRPAPPASTFPQATAKRADTCSRYNRGLCHLE